MALAWSEGDYGVGYFGEGGVAVSVSVTGVSAATSTARSDTFTCYNDAKLSTAQYKFGDASAVFDGLADYIRPNDDTAWGAGDFTLEFWFYYSSIGASNYFLFDNRIASTNGLLIYIGTDNKVNLVVNGGSGGVAISPTLTTGIWNSVAVERSGTAMSFYVNGTKTGSLSANSTNYSGRKYSIGASSYTTPGSFGFNGYIDEFRTSTTARYSGTSYTPATAEFSPDVFTTDLLHFDGANGSTVITNSATLGVIGVVGEANISPSAVEGTFAEPRGYVGVKAIVDVTGVSGVVSVGSVSTQAEVTASPTSVSAAGSIGDAKTGIGVYLTGVSGTGELGEEIAPDQQSWGGSNWGGPFLGWGGILAANVEVTGVEATGEIGTEHVQIGGAVVRPTGVAGDTALGEEDVLGKANVQVTGVSASGALGTVSIRGKAVVDVTGVVGTITEGSVTTRTANNFAVTGVEGTTALGEVDESGKARVTVTGVSATGQISTPLVWGLIDTSQTPNWLPIAA